MIHQRLDQEGIHLSDFCLNLCFSFMIEKLYNAMGICQEFINYETFFLIDLHN